MYRSNYTLGTAAIIASAGAALLAAACGSSNRVASVNSSSAGHVPKAASAVTPARLENQYLGFARCMRSHGIGDFPDPITGSGGHPGFSLKGGSRSDLNSNNPAFQRGVETCQHVLGHQF